MLSLVQAIGSLLEHVQEQRRQGRVPLAPIIIRAGQRHGRDYRHGQGRRLSDGPKAAFRPVTGLVLAVFIGTMAGVLLPAAEADASSPAAAALGTVLRDDQHPGGNLHCAVTIPPGPG